MGPELVVEELDTEPPHTRSEKGVRVKCDNAEESVTDRASFSAETGSNTAPLSRLAGLNPAQYLFRDPVLETA